MNIVSLIVVFALVLSVLTLVGVSIVEMSRFGRRHGRETGR